MSKATIIDKIGMTAGVLGVTLSALSDRLIWVIAGGFILIALILIVAFVNNDV